MAAPASAGTGGNRHTAMAKNNPTMTTNHFANSPASNRPKAIPAPATPPPKEPHAATRLPSVIAPPPTNADSALPGPCAEQAATVSNVAMACTATTRSASRQPASTVFNTPEPQLENSG